MNLTHLDEQNRPKMVDVSEKNISTREAIASGKIKMSKQAFSAVLERKTKKGAVLETAIIAAIMGAKQTSSLIPMCHLLNLSAVNCEISELESENAFLVRVRAKISGQTGVEMEALTGVSVGLLTIYDMVKAIDKKMIISDIKLERKSGGASGDFVNDFN